MNPDLDAKLCADFPLIYSVNDEDTHCSLSHFGFETGDGWFRIIHELSASWRNSSGDCWLASVTNTTPCR